MIFAISAASSAPDSSAVWILSAPSDTTEGACRAPAMCWASARLNRPSSAIAASANFPSEASAGPGRLEDAQRPVLAVTLGGDHPGVDRVQRVFVPVACRENPRSQHVRQATLRIALAAKLTALRGQQNLQRAPEVE